MDPTSYSKPVKFTPPTPRQKMHRIAAQKALAKRRIKEELDYITQLDQQLAEIFANHA